MIVSPYEQERSCSSFHLFRFSSEQKCVATESPFSPWGLIKQLALFIKCIALTTHYHHITALYSHESIPIGLQFVVRHGSKGLDSLRGLQVCNRALQGAGHLITAVQTVKFD